MTTMAPEDMNQCAMDCSTYCSVLPVNSGREASACEKQADRPIFRRVAAGNMLTKPAGTTAAGLVHCTGADWCGGRCRQMQSAPAGPSAQGARRDRPNVR